MTSGNLRLKFYEAKYEVEIENVEKSSRNNKLDKKGKICIRSSLKREKERRNEFEFVSFFYLENFSVLCILILEENKISHVLPPRSIYVKFLLAASFSSIFYIIRIAVKFFHFYFRLVPFVRVEKLTNFFTFLFTLNPSKASTRGILRKFSKLSCLFPLLRKGSIKIAYPII